MLWVRNLEQLEINPTEETMTAVIGSELSVAGVLDIRQGAILAGPTTYEPNESGLYKHELRIKLARFDAGLGDGTRKGYVYKDGPLGELAALLSLVFEARTFILSTTIGCLSDHSIPLTTEFAPRRGRYGHRVDPVVFSDRQRTFPEEATPFLQRLLRLPAKHHQAFMLAAHHYARALREIGVDDEMVFIRLVSAIEAISTDQKIPNDPLYKKTLENLVNLDAMTPSERKELENLFAVRKAVRKFSEFMKTHSKGFLRGGKSKAPHTRITRSKLPDVLEAIYDARSNYLHRGDPMYLSQRFGEYPQWHMDPSAGMIIQNRRYSAEEKLPYAHFFHSLVRHCLLSFVAQATKTAAGG